MNNNEGYISAAILSGRLRGADEVCACGSSCTSIY